MDVYFQPFFWIPSLVILGLGIWVAVDAGKYPEAAFSAVGSKKSTWQIWPIVSGLFCGIACIIMAVIWFASKKAAVAQAAGMP